MAISFRQFKHQYFFPPKSSPKCFEKEFFLKSGPNPASFCLFSFFSHDKYSTNLTINYKSVDGVLGTQTQGSRMVGADGFTELFLKCSLWCYLQLSIRRRGFRNQNNLSVAIPCWGNLDILQRMFKTSTTGKNFANWHFWCHLNYLMEYLVKGCEVFWAGQVSIQKHSECEKVARNTYLGHLPSTTI